MIKRHCLNLIQVALDKSVCQMSKCTKQACPCDILLYSYTLKYIVMPILSNVYDKKQCLGLTCTQSYVKMFKLIETRPLVFNM